MKDSNNNKYVLNTYISLSYGGSSRMEGCEQFNCISYAKKLYTTYTQFEKNLIKKLLIFIHILPDEFS